MNAFDMASRRRGAGSTATRQVYAVKPDLPQTFENRVMHSWAVAGHWLGSSTARCTRRLMRPVFLRRRRWQIEGDAKRVHARQP